MSQRDSGYARKERDFYRTPEWVTRALMPHIPESLSMVWEPAAGDWAIAHELSGVGFGVFASDIHVMYSSLEWDFLMFRSIPVEFARTEAIITNPPYELGTEFCDQALTLMEPKRGFVAMLLRTDFDHAKSRSHLFRDCPAFAKKLILTKRIVWFEPEPGSKGKSPSFNHAWFIWDWTHEGAPTLAYGP